MRINYFIYCNNILRNKYFIIVKNLKDFKKQQEV